MPISAELAKVLDLITDPAEREARRKELNDLAEGGLRQADYSRNMNQLAEERKRQTDLHAKNLEWYKTAEGQYNTAVSELKAAQERIAALESARGTPGGGDGSGGDDEGEMQRMLKQARAEQAEAQKKIDALSASVSRVDQLVKDGKLMTAERFDEEVNRRGDALGAALLDIIDLQDEHRKQFGKELDRAALLTEAQKQGGNLRNAYKVITEAAATEKLRKDIEADVERKWQEKMKTSRVPYAESGEPILGPLQQRLQKKDTGIPDDVPADGTGRLASLVAQELRQEGKF